MAFQARFWLGIVCAAALVMAGRSQDPKDPKTKQPAPMPKPKVEPKTALTRAIESMKLPAGAIFLLDDKGERVTKVFMTPEEWEKQRALLAELDMLKLKLAGKEKVTPRQCKLAATVDGDLVRLKANFTIVTTEPAARVVLGCQRAWPRAGKMDGKLPFFVPPQPGEDGLVVLINDAGDHQLELELEMPLAAQGKAGDLGFALGLAYTIGNLESLSLAGNVPELKINGQTHRLKQEGGRSKVDNVALGTVEQLDVAWKGTVVKQPGPPLLAAEARMIVHFDAKLKHITTDVDFTLEVVRGEVKEWQIQLPAFAQFQPGKLDPRIENVELPRGNDTWMLVKLKEPTAETLRFSFQIQQIRKGMVMPVGPFTVLKSIHQRGTIGVSVPAEQDVRLGYAPGTPEVIQREVPEDMREKNVVAAFHYWNLPVPADPKQLPPAPLSLSLETLKGALEARGEHALQILEKDAYQLDCKFQVTPHSTGVDRLEVQLPASFEYDERRGPTPVDLNVEIDPQRKLAVLKMTSRQTQPFSITLPARGVLPGGAQELPFDFPRVVGAYDRGGQLSVTVPESLELIERQPGAEVLPSGTHQHTWKWERTPDRVEVAWREYRPKLPVDSVVDVTLSAGQALVEQRLDFSFPDEAPAYVHVDIPKELSRPKLVQGGVLRANGLVRLENPGPKVSLAFSYTLSLPALTGEQGARLRRVPLPSIRAVRATEGKTKVRVWSEPQNGVSLPDLMEAEGGWQELHTEIVPGKPALPALVLSSERRDAALTLVEKESALAALAPVMADRALIQVAVNENGEHIYRARFLLSRLSTRTLDLEFPNLYGLNLQVFLDNRPMSLEMIEGNEAGSDLVRLKLPTFDKLPVVLDVHYQLTPGRTQGNGAWFSTFYAPVLKGDVFLGRARWQLDLPTGWVPLYQGGDFAAEQRWEWVGGLLTPHASVNGGELDHWLTGAPQQAGPPEAGLFCWRTNLEPVRLVQVPRQAWLIGSSLLFLMLGLFLAFAPLSRPLFWGAVTILGLGVVYVGVFWPSVLPALLYGIEPGLAVLIAVLLVHWLMQSHYQRQMVFLPSFTRLKPGAVVDKGTNTGTQSAWPKEPSTVDAQFRTEGRESSVRR